MSDLIEPGSTLGVLGGGQLGRMFTIAAQRMGYRVHVLAPEDDTPTGQVAHEQVRAAYDDLDAVAAFARSVSVVTFEFENVPAATTEAAARHALVRPAGSVLHTTQHRIREKTFLSRAGLPVTPFAPVRSLDELHRALPGLGCPAVLKTAAWGYDGKGQEVIHAPEDAEAAWRALGGAEAVLETFIDFEREVSVVAVRGLHGGEPGFACFGPMDNTHRRHILDLSVAPAEISPKTAEASRRIARAVVEELDVVGVLCVEFFLQPHGGLMINELAPRPHNSGHLTIDACASCQFEQQARAVCGLPLGATEQLRPAAMANLLGDLWLSGDASDAGCDSSSRAKSADRGQLPAGPHWAAALASPEVKLHLYGKHPPRPGRKMGHLTALADTADDAAALVLSARRRLAVESGHD